MGHAAADNGCYDSRAWQAELKLGFVADRGRTLLKQRRARGPLAVQRPFYPEGGLCHVYLLHPPDGIVGGDQLRMEVDVAEHAQALLTTPGATKIYRSDSRSATQTQRLTVAAHASLEWFPQESIIFDGAYVQTETHINLAPQARYIGWELVCLGRPACDERYSEGESIFKYQVWRDDKPLLLERLQLPGGAPMLTANWGMCSLPVFATMLATPVTQKNVQTIRDSITAPVFAGMTLIEDLLVCRYLGNDVEQARNYFRTIRTLLRPDIINKPACDPRIWYT